MNLFLTHQSTSKIKTPDPRTLKRWVTAALNPKITKKKVKNVEITLRFVDMREGRRLNREFRGKDYATNVLTFVYENGDTCIGDLVICMPVVLKEAKAQQKHWRAHCCHLVVHGVLHLLGFDHENDLDADIMETHESAILLNLGYANPYLNDETD
jgi:probable rRNA maturation factor